MKIQKAIDQLVRGNVVALPTETVYGLAARIDQLSAVELIFKTKNRPFFDPLIVHVHSIEQAKTLVARWPAVADSLAKAFWPGPLTLVLPKSATINPMITAGLEEVAVRMPKHPLFLEVLKGVGVPLAAPSANRFGQTSPTTADHVRSEFEDSVQVLDGGPCDVGIESTIVAVRGLQLEILRAGMISKADLEAATGDLEIQWTDTAQKIAPGQMKFHYMPQTPLLIVKGDAAVDTEWVEKKIRELPATHEGIELRRPQKIKKILELELPTEPLLAARVLYSRLRELSQAGGDLIVFRLLSVHQTESWLAVMDRLSKAAILKLNN